MFNRKDTNVRPLAEELEGIGLDPESVMDDIERNAGLLEQHASNPPASDAVRRDVIVEGDEGAEGAKGAKGAKGEPDAKLGEQEIVSWDDDFENFSEGAGSSDDDSGDSDDDVEEHVEGVDFTSEDVEALKELLGCDLDEAYRRVKVGFRQKGGKIVRVTKQQKQKEKRARRKGRSKAKTASKKYQKRFARKIAKRRKLRAKKGSSKKGFRMVQQGVEQELANLREELESSGAVTEMSQYEEATLNAGWLAMLLGECFEAMGDTEAGEMLFTMSDSAAAMSEEIEANSGEVNEDIEPKLTSLLEGVSKALASHENLGSPSLFESIDMGIANGLYEDEELDAE